ncbi:hypothetical protein WJX74_002559 [Apatococcus lobatus]|uniref:Uncharacterized protein n=1 Tax=Apatococcus lobatus TaxID=904363 RepID=A0AAW1QBL4_9CHLO
MMASESQSAGRPARRQDNRIKRTVSFDEWLRWSDTFPPPLVLHRPILSDGAMVIQYESSNQSEHQVTLTLQWLQLP